MDTKKTDLGGKTSYGSSQVPSGNKLQIRSSIN